MEFFFRIKKWLSYLFELHIESAPSALNPHLYVSLSKGRYQLSTAHAIYSFEDLYDNFARAFNLIKWQELKCENILVLGGGLLSVPQLLDKKLINSCIYDVVEIDENVIYLADKYITHKLSNPVHWYHDAAESFVRTHQGSMIYDLIIVDVFEDDQIPQVIQSEAFLKACSGLLSPKGLLLYNRLSRTHKDRSSTQEFISRSFQPRFPDGGYLDVKGNYILYNRPHFWLSEAQLHSIKD